MVELVERFQDFTEATEYCRLGVYQIRDLEDGVEVRIRAGRFGYIGIYDDRENPEFKAVKNFCAAKCFIKIKGHIPDEMFFTAPVVD